MRPLFCNASDKKPLPENNSQQPGRLAWGPKDLPCSSRPGLAPLGSGVAQASAWMIGCKL